MRKKKVYRIDIAVPPLYLPATKIYFQDLELKRSVLATELGVLLIRGSGQAARISDKDLAFLLDDFVFLVWLGLVEVNADADGKSAGCISIRIGLQMLDKRVFDTPMRDREAVPA